MAATGRANARWNDGDMLSSHGYKLVRVGIGHPLADSRGYAYEHELVWVSAGRERWLDHVRHHINGDKTDNRIENLEQIPRSEHGKLHAAERTRERGRFVAESVAAQIAETASVKLDPAPKDARPIRSHESDVLGYLSYEWVDTVHEESKWMENWERSRIEASFASKQQDGRNSGPLPGDS